MKPVQLILIMMLLSIILLYFSKFRSGIIDRILVLCFGALGILMACFPDITTYIAELVGVGRGVDLFTALALVGIAFFGLVIYSRIRELEAKITQLSRAVAVENAIQPTEQTESQAKSKN